MKKILFFLMLLPSLALAQTFPVNNLQINGAVSGNVSGTGNVVLQNGPSITGGSVNNAIGSFTTLSSITPPTLGASTFYPTVATNAALQAFSTLATSSITRLGFYSSGDSPALLYQASASPCSLNAGAGDNGSQVKSSNNLCWLAVLPPGGPFDIRDWGAYVNGANEDSTAVQNAINYASNNGGGIVWFPAGKTLLNSGVTVGIGGVTLKGMGWQEYNSIEGSNSAPGPNASWILSTTTAHTPVTFANTVENAGIDGIAFQQTQPADAPGWTPTVYPPSINILGSAASSGAVDVENVFCWQCYEFIRVGSVGNLTGRGTFKHIWGQPLALGLNIIASSDTNIIDDVHFWPFATVSSNILAWVQANGIAIKFTRSDNPLISNVFAYGYQVGVQFTSSTDGATQRFQMTNIDLDSANTGFQFLGTSGSTSGQMANVFVTAESGAGSSSYGINVGNSNYTYLTITNFRSTGAGSSCVALSGSTTTAVDVAITNAWCDNWNQVNGGFVGFNVGQYSTLTLSGRLYSNGGNGASLTFSGGTGAVLNQSHVN